ncbi:MAG: ribonuclease P protein component [Candidatus Moranbacteria bacterium]|nr:ribonuclease P protein component [Candidatus Moranbacteria bacterium]
MLPINNRLKKREDFAKVFSQGTYAAFGNVSLKYSKNSLPQSRIGFPVGKNYSKKAVTRNRVRRILRAISSKHLSSLKPGFDIVIMIRPGYQNPESKVLDGELHKAFSKANLFV